MEGTKETRRKTGGEADSNLWAKQMGTIMQPVESGL